MKNKIHRSRALDLRWIAVWAALGWAAFASAADRKIVMLAGHMSHGPGDHEFRAGSLLLQKCLASVPGVRVEVHRDDWPVDPEAAFAGADAVLVYADGNAAHPLLPPERTALINRLAKSGVGLGFMHFAVGAIPERMGAQMHDWVGAYYQSAFSANPMWTPSFLPSPEHAVMRGVGSVDLRDEWYFHLRFREDGVGTITPILAANPGAAVRAGPYVYPKGPYPHVMANEGRPEIVMWTYERVDGGRSFGFTGGHSHENWGHDDFRKVVLNAMLWIAGAEVPAAGVESSVSAAELAANLDPK